MSEENVQWKCWYWVYSVCGSGVVIDLVDWWGKCEPKLGYLHCVLKSAVPKSSSTERA